MLVRVLRDGLKWDGARHAAGSVLDIPFDTAARMLRHNDVEYIEQPVSEEAPNGGDSHSDFQIELVNALRDAIPALQPKPAAALVAAGFETAEMVLTASDEDLVAVDGVAKGTLDAIAEARASGAKDVDEEQREEAPNGGDSTTDCDAGRRGDPP